MQTTGEYLVEQLAAAWAPPFRGEIYEYAAKLDLQQGYAVKGRLQMEVLGHILPPLRAIRHSDVRLVSIRGAVQTTKSLIADICVPYWIEHDPGDVLWLFEDDQKAQEYADRCISLIKSIPSISGMLEEVDRHDKTKTRLRFKHMKVVVCGLNAGNVQSLSWRYVIVDETWMHPHDGLIRQAMDRTKQYPSTKKILLIGQGGVENDDHDVEHKACEQHVLGFACPACGRHQPFELSRIRPETSPAEALRGTYSGLTWDKDERTYVDGRWNYDYAAGTAHIRCYFCDHRIEDTPSNRRKLNDSYVYLPTGDEWTADGWTPPPMRFTAAMAFEWPAEASMRIPLSYLVRKYLRAKDAADGQAYKLPLKEFYQKERGKSWSEDLGAGHRAIAREDYDPAKSLDDAAYRVLICDCQRDLAKFYYTAFAVKADGEARELERGTAASFSELAEIQKRYQIKDQFVFLDCGYRMTDVLRECVKHGHVASIKVGGAVKKIWRCWTGLKGSPQELFLHENPKTGVKEYRVISQRRFYDTNLGTGNKGPRSPWYEFSNLHCKDLLRARRDGETGIPKLLTLPDTLPPDNQESYTAQMHSEARAEVYTGNRKRSIWAPVTQGRPNHFWDIGSMLMAFLAIVGIVGTSTADSEADKAG